MPSCERCDRGAREVREVFVIDGVERTAVDEVPHVGVLDHGDAVGGEQRRDSRDEIVRIGSVGEHVVRDDHVCWARALAHGLRQRSVEELLQRRHAGSGCGLGLRRRRVDSEHRDATLDEVPQQVAVVRGDLDDEAAAVEPTLLDQRHRLLAGVAE